MKRPAIILLLSAFCLAGKAFSAEPVKLAFDTYSGYFVSDKFEPDAAKSFVVTHDQEQFDKVFGVAFVMRDKSHRLPKDAFQSRLVIAAIARGNALVEYKVEGVTDAKGVVEMRYSTTEKKSDTFTVACPLIVSIPKGEYRAVEFVENGKPVKKIALGADAAAKPIKFAKFLADNPVVTPGIVYRMTTAENNRMAFDKIWQVFVAGDRRAAADDLTGSILICGPGLWQDIKDDPEMQKIKLGVTKMNVPTNDGVQVLEGKLFQNKDEVGAFWKAFWRRYKPDPQAKIRSPTAKELETYWAMISFDITEPMFMIESKDATILAQFADDKMKLGWIDDYKDVRLAGER